MSGPGYESGCYVAPALAEAENSYGVVQEETFAPILYLIRYEGGVENAVALQNGGASRPVLGHFHHRPARSRILPFRGRFGLRSGQR